MSFISKLKVTVSNLFTSTARKTREFVKKLGIVINFMSFANFLYTNKMIINSVFLTIVVLALSTFSSVYSNVYHNIKVAEINQYFYERSTELASGEEASIYQDMSNRWDKLAESLRDKLKLRAYSTNCSFFSLGLLLLTFILLLLCRKPWCMISLIIPIFYLILASLIYIFPDYDWSIADKICFWKLVAPEP